MNQCYLKADWQDEWEEVSKEQWIKAERGAGFRPKLYIEDSKYMTTCATGGFYGNGVSGKIEYND
ncbi:hypothetical protein LCGC14_1937830, partial [marine sediment metagenome]